MTSSTFSFVLATAALGMAIVFVFLTLLSLVMKGIRGVDALIDRATGSSPAGAGPAGSAGSARPAGSAKAVAGAQTAGPAAESVPTWVTAAVAAFVDAELSVHAHSATAWTSRSAR